MSNTSIKKMLKSDIEFVYNGKNAAFCPIDVFIVGFSGDENTFNDIDSAINARVFDGKSLVDIWDIVLPQIS